MRVDFLDFLKKGRGKFAFVATYEFDPQFFERRILCAPAFDGASVVVFVDEDRYREILLAGRQGEGFDRNYFVIPISRERGVFHPKLYMSIGDKKALASVGSNNCTSAGTGHNFELVSTLESSSGEERGAEACLISSIFRQFLQYAREAGPVSRWLEREIFDHAVADYPWLNAAHPTGAADNIEFLSSHESPLWPQVVARLGGTDIRLVTLLSPFFGKDLRIIERIRALWPAAAVRIVSQSGYSNLPVEEFVALRDRLGNIELFSASPQKAGRNMHAKALALESADCTYWLAGSANMSNAALAGGNSEACLWFSTKQTADEALQHDELTFAPLDPEKFTAAAIEEPIPAAEQPHGLKLNSLILTDEGQLLVSGSVPAKASDVKLRIFKRHETLPTFSWKVGAPATDITLALKEGESAKFDRPAIGQLQGIVDGHEVTSQPCSVKQLPRLLRDRSSGSAAGNRLQRILENGDGLIEYVDALDGIDAAIDFMNNTTIRFRDDGRSGGAGGSVWRARDPFSGDVPDHWAMGSSGGSVIELREAIWDFVQRHIGMRLERHVGRGNLAGLGNFLDIYRIICRVLLTWHHRKIGEEAVIPCPFVTTGMQEILSALIGARGGEQADLPGYGRALMISLSADKDLVRAELDRHRVAALVRTTLEEMIRARALSLKRSTDDSWSQTRRDWVSDWIGELQLCLPSEGDLQEIGAEFRLAA